MLKNKKIDANMLDDLYSVIISLSTRQDCELLLSDLCTDKEICQMAQRLRAAKLLMEGKTYNQVMAQTDISSATLSRVSRSLQYGGGYIKFLK